MTAIFTMVSLGTCRGATTWPRAARVPKLLADRAFRRPAPSLPGTAESAARGSRPLAGPDPGPIWKTALSAGSDFLTRSPPARRPGRFPRATGPPAARLDPEGQDRTHGRPGRG